MKDIQEALANGLKYKCEMAMQKFAEFEATGRFDQEDFGFAQELAMQYGASHIDDNATVLVITAADLYVMMCVLGYSRAKKGDQSASQEQAECKHHFTYFGDHPVRRCAWCSTPESASQPQQP